MTTPNIGENVEKPELLYIADGNVGTFWQFITKLNIHLACDLEVLLYMFTQEK